LAVIIRNVDEIAGAADPVLNVDLLDGIIGRVVDIASVERNTYVVLPGGV
jgi:hypothetical protein